MGLSNRCLYLTCQPTPKSDQSQTPTVMTTSTADQTQDTLTNPDQFQALPEPDLGPGIGPDLSTVRSSLPVLASLAQPSTAGLRALVDW